MLHKTNLPLSYWSYAFSTNVYLLNRIPSSVLNFVSPWQRLYLRKLFYHALKVFGCACFPFFKPYSSHKFDPKSRMCIFLGYPPLSKGYIYLKVSTRKVYISPHCIFHESMFPSLSSMDYVPSPSSLPIFDPWFATLLPFFVPSTFDSSIPIFCSLPSVAIVSSSSIDTASLPNPNSTLVIVPTMSTPLSSLSVPNNTHPILTRSKNRIFKPKAYVVQANCYY